MPALLSVDNVTAGYGRIEVLHGISLDVPEGSVVALLGPNGSGKTTAMRAISGTLPVWSGSVRLGRRRLDGRTAHTIARAGLALVPEGRGIFPALTCEEHLDIAVRGAFDLPSGAGRGAARRARIDEVLEAFPQLRARLGQRAGTMSGGEQQMLALARAFICRPKLLLLDEISMGLAPLVVERLFDRVLELKQSGMTLLVVEQYLAHALSVADICYVLNKGRVSFVGEPAELRSGAALAAPYLAG